MTAFVGIRGAALFIIGVAVVGVLGYRFLEGYSWLEAFYMVAITLSTVGYREVRPLSPEGQIFTIFLLAGGIGAFFYTAVAVVEKVVEGEFQRFFGRRRMQKKIEALRDHYLVCGFGRIGEVICRELASKPVPFVVLEQDEERVRTAEINDYLVLQGDAADEKMLMAAGVQRARGLFAALASDAGNVFVTLTAKELNPLLFVVARAENERSERTLLRAGADKVTSPYAMGGHRMAQAALRPAVVDIIDLAAHHQSLELQLEEITIPASSPCHGKALQDAQLCGQPGMIIVAIKRASGKMVFNPPPAERVESGDSLIALAEAPQLKEIERRVKGENQEIL
jgi:voltage-gated potassium channel